MKIKTALISVSDKTGILDFAKGLCDSGVKILSTGGTAKLLKENAIAVQNVEDYTGFPEMLDGRVKTLHPKIHGGILAVRENATHMAKLAEHGIETIDLVCVNLYPFLKTVAKADVTLSKAIENIDIGGPSMVRAAAKNYKSVAVVTDPADYSLLLDKIQNNQAFTVDFLFSLAKKAFTHTAQYDSAISNWLTSLENSPADSPDSPVSKNDFPQSLSLNFKRAALLRYGENPHQSAAFYKNISTEGVEAGGLANFEQLNGKELSFNNLADSDAAWRAVNAFDAPACVIIKHANPCGVAVANSLKSAYEKAFQTDSVSAFGGILAFNGRVEKDVAQAIAERKHFVEVLLAPDFSPEALAAFSEKKNLRLLKISQKAEPSFDFKKIEGGLLVQSADRFIPTESDLTCVTNIAPTQSQIKDLLFAMRVAKFVKSNAIVYCKDDMTLGIGAGQMSRVDSAKIAAEKAQTAGFSLKGSVVASDAFFPFRDGLDVLARAGAIAVIQPGGSVRDAEVIAAANEHGIAMVFTGHRHFWH